jgi:hypothetical protein
LNQLEITGGGSGSGYNLITVFDTTVVPLNLEKGVENPDLPNLRVAQAPRRANRSRTEDLLVMLVTPTGTVSFSQDYLTGLFDHLTDHYFQTSGPVTSGLRAVAQALNSILLKHNVKTSGSEQALAQLNLAVIRRGMLYLGLSGTAPAYICSREGIETYGDTNASPRALGLGRSLHQAFYQHEISPGALLVLSGEPPAGWTPALLSNCAAMPLDQARRRLLGHASNNVNAVVLQFQSGNGEVQHMRRRSPVSLSGAPRKNAQADKTLTERKPPPPSQPVIRKKKPLKLELPVRQQLAKIWLAAANMRQRAGSIFNTIAERLLPGSSQNGSAFPTGTLLFIAVAVPLIIVAVATTVYFQRGRGFEYQRTLQEAVQLAERAQAEEDAAMKRMLWEQTLTWIDRAEEYDQSEEAELLRQLAYDQIDEMDGVTRLNVQRAVYETFAPNIHFNRMAANETDVYLLESGEGRIVRLFLTGQGFEVDANFNCGQGPTGAVIIGPLVDMVVLSPNQNNQATVMGVDGSGNLLYCAPGEVPTSDTLLPPDMDWGRLTAITHYQGVLYALDRDTNAVWIYTGTDMQFSDLPTLYFEADIPDLGSVIDLTINNDEMFLLRQNGEMITCIASPYLYTSARCEDPASYGDLRPGRESDVLFFEEAVFTQLQSTQPPDPSLFILDVNANAIYQFSLRLNLLRQLRLSASQEESLPDGAPTAFTITSDRMLLIAYNNQVFYTQLP